MKTNKKLSDSADLCEQGRKLISSQIWKFAKTKQKHNNFKSFNSRRTESKVLDVMPMPKLKDEEAAVLLYPLVA